MTVYTMKHDTIKFSSVNTKQVEYYENILSSVTLNDIKSNNIEGRHALLLNMGLAGDCPLFDEYMRVRGIRQKTRESFLSNVGKFSTTTEYGGEKMFFRDAAELHADKHVKDNFGWVL